MSPIAKLLLRTAVIIQSVPERLLNFEEGKGYCWIRRCWSDGCYTVGPRKQTNDHSGGLSPEIAITDDLYSETSCIPFIKRFSGFNARSSRSRSRRLRRQRWW